MSNEAKNITSKLWKYLFLPISFITKIAFIAFRLNNVSEENRFKRGTFIFFVISVSVLLELFNIFDLGLTMTFIRQFLMGVLLMVGLLFYIIFPCLYRFFVFFSVFVIYVGVLISFIFYWNFDIHDGGDRVLVYYSVTLFIVICQDYFFQKILFSVCFFFLVVSIVIYDLLRKDRDGTVMEKFQSTMIDTIHLIILPVFSSVVILYFYNVKKRTERLLTEVVRGISELNLNTKAIRQITRANVDERKIPEHHRLLRQVIFNVKSYIPYLPRDLMVQEREDVGDDDDGMLFTKTNNTRISTPSSGSNDFYDSDDDDEEYNNSNGSKNASEDASSTNSDTSSGGSLQREEMEAMNQQQQQQQSTTSSSSSSSSSSSKKRKTNNKNIVTIATMNNKKQKKKKKMTGLNQNVAKGRYLNARGVTVGLVNIVKFHQFSKQMKNINRNERSSSSSNVMERRKHILKIHSEYVELVSKVIHKNGGIIHSFFGDRILFSFNSSIRCITHGLNAVYASMEILECWEKKQQQQITMNKKNNRKGKRNRNDNNNNNIIMVPDLRISIVSDVFEFGTLGCETFRRFSIIGDSMSYLFSMNNRFSHYRNEILVDSNIREATKFHIHSKLIDIIKYRKEDTEEEEEQDQQEGGFEVFRILRFDDANRKKKIDFGNKEIEWMYEIDNIFLKENSNTETASKTKNNKQKGKRKREVQEILSEIFVFMQNGNWTEAEKRMKHYLEEKNSIKTQRKLRKKQQQVEEEEEEDYFEESLSIENDERIIRRKLKKREFVSSVFNA